MEAVVPPVRRAAFLDYLVQEVQCFLLSVVHTTAVRLQFYEHKALRLEVAEDEVDVGSDESAGGVRQVLPYPAGEE